MNPLNSIINLSSCLEDYFQQQRIVLEEHIGESDATTSVRDDMDTFEMSLHEVKQQLNVVKMIQSSSL